MTDQPPTLRELLEVKLDAHDEKLDAILAEVKLTNGRVRTAEKAIAVLQVGYVVGGAILAGVGAWLFGKVP